LIDWPGCDRERLERCEGRRGSSGRQRSVMGSRVSTPCRCLLHLSRSPWLALPDDGDSVFIIWEEATSWMMIDYLSDVW
jgi:hypothetical protein